MYASSILGWLDFLCVRTGSVYTESPVGSSERMKCHADACQLGLLELATQLNPLFDPAIAPIEPPEREVDTMKTVLGRINNGRAPRLDSLEPAVGRIVDRSPRWEIVDGYVFVIVDTTEYETNIPPVLSVVADSLITLLNDIQRIIKFLEADNLDVTASLINRWKHSGGLVFDLYRGCIRVLRQVDRRNTVRDSMDEFMTQKERATLTDVNHIK